MAAVDWGSVPEWVGAILTGAGFLVAALVYRHERAERMSETARRVHVTYRPDKTLLIRNDGAAPIQHLQIYLYDLVLDAEPGRTLGWLILPDLQPGDRLVEDPETEFGEELPRHAAYALEFSFVDGDGRAWHRNWWGKLTRER